MWPAEGRAPADTLFTVRPTALASILVHTWFATSADALAAGIHRLGVGKIAMITPYLPALTSQVVDYDSISLGFPDSREVARLDRNRLIDLSSRLELRHPAVMGEIHDRAHGQHRTFTTDDDVEIGYRKSGRGPPLVRRRSARWRPVSSTLTRSGARRPSPRPCMSPRSRSAHGPGGR